MSKQDGYSPRTAADLERKYNFGKTFAEIYGLAADARKAAEEAQNAFEGLDQNHIFNLLTNYGKAQGIYRDDTGNVYVNASYIQSGVLPEDQVPASIARKSDIPELVGQLIAEDGSVVESGVTNIVKGVVTTDYVNALGIDVYAAQIKDTLVIGKQLPSNLAVKSEIPKNLSQLVNDKGFVQEKGVTTIIDGYVDTDYVNALGISVDAANVKGKLVIGQLPSNIATSSDIPTLTSQLTNDSGYVNPTGVVSIVEGTVTADYVNALNLKVSAANITGTLNIGQIPSEIARYSDIPWAVSQLDNDVGYENRTGIVSIVNGIVTADYVNALGVYASTLQTTGASWQRVAIANGTIDFYSGSISDNSYGALCMSASALHFISESGVRFEMWNGSYWILDTSGMWYYDRYGNPVSHFQLV